MDVFSTGWWQEGHPASKSLHQLPHPSWNVLSFTAIPFRPSLCAKDMVLNRMCGEGESNPVWPGRTAVELACVFNHRVWRCEDWTAEMWTTSHGRCQVSTGMQHTELSEINQINYRQKWSDLWTCFQAACWSSDDSVMLFATANEPLIYMILFDEGNMSVTANIGAVRRAQAATPIIDLSPVERQLEDLSSAR